MVVVRGGKRKFRTQKNPNLQRLVHNLAIRIQSSEMSQPADKKCPKNNTSNSVPATAVKSSNAPAKQPAAATASASSSTPSDPDADAMMNNIAIMAAVDMSGCY